MAIEKIVVGIDPWPANPIERYTSIDSGPWGYLKTYNDGTFEFSQEVQPSREEILSRWGIRLSE